jgi:chromosome segregation ATPase
MLTYEKATEALRSITAQIRDLEKQLRTAIDERADAEGAYRSQYAYRLREHREAGSTVAEAEAYARADVVVLSRARDSSEYRIRELLERLEDRRGERHSLHRLIDWSRGAPPEAG